MPNPNGEIEQGYSLKEVLEMYLSISCPCFVCAIELSNYLHFKYGVPQEELIKCVNEITRDAPGIDQVILSKKSFDKNEWYFKL